MSTERMGEAVSASRKGMIAVAVFSFGENLLLLAAPLYMLQVYDRVLSSRSMDTLIYLTLILALALITLAMLEYARGRVLASVGTWLDHKLSPVLFERAIESRIRGRSYGAESINDLATLRNFVPSTGMKAMFDLPWTLIFLGASFLLHPYFGYLALGTVVILVLLGLIGEFVTRDAIAKSNEMAMVARRELNATVRNVEVIEAMGMMGNISRKWRERNGGALELQDQVFGRTTTIAAITKFFRMFVQSLTLGLGAWLVLNQEATGGVMIAASILLTRAVGPIEQCIGSWKNIVTVRGAWRRLKEFVAEPRFRTEAMELPEPKGHIACEGLVMTPQKGGAPILKGVNFTLEAGESLAVVGPSGAGKSTLARLVVGALPPTRGLVRLDGADVFTWNREQMNKYVGYLPQDVELFAGTVAENIARLGDVDPEKVVAAAKLARVHDLIVRLPNGYETEIGEGGQHLSGGQRQRIALARAVYGQPRLLVMDEPNSNLDSDGEIALMATMDALKKAGATVLVVTHRPSLVQHVDKMLLLREGQVEAFGPRQEVIARLVKQPQGQEKTPQPQPSKPAAPAKTAATGSGGGVLRPQKIVPLPNGG
ncbi:type I secretion system permease/ATPase [Jiella marina]|uniref:type I secretion system permease/ATPase n=1 Tax=Jiella sp. LLJ827 TaxID=2917712 RepID=UPI002100D00D|nr:type I secretion system permease/ATPase [Jiella sp. LLJ827]MCQ0988466.1 type I secretion system permease/ATPase [Jiella sp. LLJ827]